MAVAVRYLHGQRVSHRDLKLENFMLAAEEGWELRLIDFGLSFPWTRAMREEVSAREERPVGTCYYMSPEVLGGSYDERCDIWSLGVVLYMMTTGTPPFDGEKESEIVANIQRGNYSLKSTPLPMQRPSAKGSRPPSSTSSPASCVRSRSVQLSTKS
jgi:calcium-dependent protein kinase